MANLTGISAPPEKRDAFLSRLRAMRPPFEGLSTGETKFNKAVLDWAVPPSTELRAAPDGASFVLELGRRSDGYFLSFRERADGRVTVETDALGIFPVYYYSTPDLLVFSSTPSVFKHVPEFSARLSAEGLAGILLTHVMVGGQTLLEGVKRLTPGHALIWNRGAAAEETKTHFPETGDRHFGRSFEENLERVDGLLRTAVEKSRSKLLLFSGGMDSRVLAGYMRQAHGKSVRAVTQGQVSDFETECARNVTKHCGWKHDIHAVDPGSFESFAMLKLEQEHLAHGFSTPYFMQLAAHLKPFGMPVVNGSHGDSAFGAGTLARARDPRTGEWTFDAHFAHLNRAGLPPDAIRRLVPPGLLKDALERVIGKMKTHYESLPGEPFQKAWLFDLVAADRMQVGFIPRMLAFGAWPVLPFLHPDLLEAVGNMPYEALEDRRLEREILCRRFADLSVLRMDHNSFNTRPVFGLRRLLQRNDLSLPQVITLLREHAKARIRERVETQKHVDPGADKRFYYQTFDLNGPGWLALRRRAESARRSAERFFDPKALKEHWPDVSQPIHFKDVIVEGAPMKILIGFALWAEENLS